MGTKMAPTYANIFMMNLEEEKLKKTTLIPTVWRRFIDDIFAIYRGSEDELKETLEQLNTMHDTIKFTYNYSSTSIDFLDTTVYVTTAGKLMTKLFRKPTDVNTYLHYSSYHPKAQRDSIPYGIALRFKLICTDPKEFDKEANTLLKQLTSRGHPHRRTKTVIDTVRQLDRRNLLEESPRTEKALIPFVVQNNPYNTRITRYLRSAGTYLRNTPTNQNFMKHKMIVAYRKPPNLRDILVHSTFPRPTTRSGSHPCMQMSCKICENLITTDKVISHQTGKTYNIVGHNTCRSLSIVYCITCPVCTKQYIGETGRTLAERIVEHKRDILKRNKASPVTPDQIYVTPLDNSAKTKNIRLRLEEAWIRVLQTLHPTGINAKL